MSVVDTFISVNGRQMTVVRSFINDNVVGMKVIQTFIIESDLTLPIIFKNLQKCVLSYIMCLLSCPTQ